ncbi:MAG: ADP-ribosylglycohydrolase family protein [Lachnospiraceae bacterium]|nr:ADP-ribosylglycohydrolase family protein [Lachnospiraceae bacterium]
MFGAILGDVIGSAYEKNNVSTTDFPLFTPQSTYTCDTVMSLAVAKGLIEGYGNPRKTRAAVIEALKEYGKKYPGVEYERNFAAWLTAANPRPYINSGCDAAVRASSCAWVYNSLKYVEHYAEITAKITHSNPEAIKAAKALCSAIFLARQAVSKEYIIDYITDVYYYDLTKTVDELRKNNKFSKEAADTAPLAFAAFLEGNSYEEVIRLAVSMGGDSDAISCMAGSIAEAYYPIPDEIKEQGLAKLDDNLKNTLKSYNDTIETLRTKRMEKFKRLLELKPFFDKRAKTEWYAPKPVDNITPFPYPKYGDEVMLLEEIIQDMDFGDFNYEDTLQRYEYENAELKDYGMGANAASPYLLKAMLTDIVRKERFVDGNIADAVRYGVISTILSNLQKKLKRNMF